MGEEHYLAWISIAASAVTATAVATAYLSSKIDKKIERRDFEDAHQTLMSLVYKLHQENARRISKLEIWAARHNGVEKDD